MTYVVFTAYVFLLGANGNAKAGKSQKSLCKIEAQVLTIEEYEVVRHVDYQKMTHEECARQMAISRTTVTEIYETARYKIADSLINGKILCIEGGNYRVCEGGECCIAKGNSCSGEGCGHDE